MHLQMFDPSEVVASQFHLDVGFDCNMNCKFCYDAVNRKKSLDTITNTVTNLKNLVSSFSFPRKYGAKRLLITIWGGEPTIYDELFNIVELTKTLPIQIVVSTNGLRIATDDKYAKELFSHCDRHVTFSTDWSWANDENLGNYLYNCDPLFKIQFLEQLRKFKRKRNHITHIIPRDTPIDLIKSTLNVVKNNKDVLSTVGYLADAHTEKQISTDEFLDIIEQGGIISKEQAIKNSIFDGSMYEECGDKRCCIRFTHKDYGIIRFSNFEKVECPMKYSVLSNGKLAHLQEHVKHRNGNKL